MERKRKLRVTGLALMLMSAMLLHSQSKVSYKYDAVGNRTSRTISASVITSVVPETMSNVEVKIYPNPTDGLLNVEITNLPENLTADILLYSLQGQLLVSHKKVSGLTEVDINNQASGTYLMKIVAGEYQTEWKIIKN